MKAKQPSAHSISRIRLRARKIQVGPVASISPFVNSSATLLEIEFHRHFTPVQQQARYDLDGLAESIRCVARALHECQQLEDPFFFFRTL
jgi:hypothetical protein